MPRFLVMVKGTPADEAAGPPPVDEMEKMFSEMTTFNERLADAGVMLAGEGLQPTKQGKKVRFEGGKTTVIDGPFTEAKEFVAGYWLLQVKSMDEAVEWIRQAPVFDGGAEVEIRQISEPDELGEAYTPELRAREQALAAKINQR
jgi:hypothetical protein